VPPAQFTFHYANAADDWYVYDHLLNRVVRTGTSALAAARDARALEEDWRAQCDRWQRADNRGNAH